MIEVYLLLGSNEGKREHHLLHGINLLNFRCGQVLKQSSVYETEPWGLKEQAPFLNMAISLRTRFSPHDLLNALKTCEKEAGRIQTVHWGPRVLDIDVLFYGNKIIQTPDLIILHPHIQERKFTLEPLCELAPKLVHPATNVSLEKLLKNCPDKSAVKKLGPLEKP